MNSHFRLKIGNTERQAETIIKDIRKADLPIDKVKLDSIVANDIFLNISLTESGITEDELKRSLNEYGGCLYQVISVNKVQNN